MQGAEPNTDLPARALARSLLLGSIGLVLLALLGAVLTQATDLQGSGALHLQIEYFAVFAATSIFLLSSAKYLITRERPYLALSLGFFGAAIFDFLHPLVPPGEFPLNFLGMDLTIHDLDGYLWWMGRLAFGLGLLVAGLGRSRGILDAEPARILLRGLVWALSEVLVVTIVLVLLPLPAYHGPGGAQPYLEVGVGLLYVVAALILARGASSADLGVRIVGTTSLAIGAVAQLFAAFSPSPLDARFFIAHGAKVLSYLAVLFGLYLEHIQLYEGEHRLRQKVEGAEARAERSRAELFSVIQTLPDGIAITDAQAQVLHLNPSAQEMLGRAGPTSLLEAATTEPGAEAAPKPLRDTILDVVRGGQAVSGRQLVYTRPDGERRNLSVGVVPLRNDAGKPRGTVVDLHDETQLLSMERRYRELAEGAPDGIVEMNELGQITLFNPAAERIFGYLSSEMLGQDVTRLMPDRLKPRHTEARERFFRTGVPTMMGRPLELVGTRKDGTEIPVELTLSATGHQRVTAIVRDVRILQRSRRERAGTVAVAQAVNATTDVAELCQAAAAGLQQALSYEAVWVYVREAGRVVLRLSGSHPGTTKGYERRLEPPDSSVAVRTFLERRAQSAIGKPVASELHPLGAPALPPFPVLHSVPIQLGQDVIGVLQALSSTRRFPEEEELPVLQSVAFQLALALSQKRLLQELQETARTLRITNQELDSFIYTASHDLAEPLRSMANFSQFLMEDYSNVLDAHGRDYVKRIHDGSLRMRELLDALLRLSRIKHVPVPFENVDPHQVLNEVRDSLDALLRDRKGELVIRGDFPRVRAQRSRLMEVFSNLVTNGLKFNESPAPRVEVAASAAGGLVEFQVKDNGIGIPAQYHEQIFGLFTRLHSRGQYAGTGAGLAIVRTIIEQHGGTIRVLSENGAGTTFVFTIAKEAG